MGKRLLIQQDRQHSAVVTMLLLRLWLSDRGGLTISEISHAVGVDYRCIWDLMQNLMGLPYLSCEDGKHIISLDCPIWRLGTLPFKSFKNYKRASLITYLITYTSLLGIGITTQQLSDLLQVHGNTIRYIIDGLSADIPVWKDGIRWKILSDSLDFS